MMTIIVAVGFIIIISTVISNIRKSRRLRNHGIVVTAKITKKRFIAGYYRGGSPPEPDRFAITAVWTNPQTRKKHEFRSTVGITRLTNSYKEGSLIQVVVNPKNMKDYFMRFGQYLEN